MTHFYSAKHALYTVVAQSWLRWTLLSVLTVGLAATGVGLANFQLNSPTASNPSNLSKSSAAGSDTLQVQPDNTTTTLSEPTATDNQDNGQTGTQAPDTNYSYSWQSGSSSSTYTYDDGSGVPVSGGSGAASSYSSNEDSNGSHGSAQQWQYQPGQGDAWRQTYSHSW